MKLPNFRKAVVDSRKLKDYCLNPHHPVGKHKARVFKSALGFQQEDAETLKEQIIDSLLQAEAEKKHEDQFGVRYAVEFPVSNKERKATIVTIWMVPNNNDKPYLITCYVKT